VEFGRIHLNKRKVSVAGWGIGLLALLLMLFIWRIYHVVTDDSIDSEFHHYAEIGDIGGIEELLKKGHPVDFAASEVGETPLWIAAGRDNVKCVDYLLAQGASVNAKDSFTGGTPITQANDPAIIEALVDHGADPNATGRFNKFTALHRCAEQGHEETVLFLLRHGANPLMADNDGKKPALVAEAAGHYEIAAILHKAEKTWMPSH
jgi:ankyrin repeat protein